MGATADEQAAGQLRSYPAAAAAGLQTAAVGLRGAAAGLAGACDGCTEQRLDCLVYEFRPAVFPFQSFIACALRSALTQTNHE